MSDFICVAVGSLKFKSTNKYKIAQTNTRTHTHTVTYLNRLTGAKEQTSVHSAFLFVCIHRRVHTLVHPPIQQNVNIYFAQFCLSREHTLPRLCSFSLAHSLTLLIRSHVRTHTYTDSIVHYKNCRILCIIGYHFSRAQQSNERIHTATHSHVLNRREEKRNETKRDEKK